MALPPLCSKQLFSSTLLVEHLQEDVLSRRGIVQSTLSFLGRELDYAT